MLDPAYIGLGKGGVGKKRKSETAKPTPGKALGIVLVGQYPLTFVTESDLHVWGGRNVPLVM